MEKHITVERTARYFTLGELNEQTEHIWFACHGYGQLAEYFIKKFQVLDNGKTVVVAPEGLSRFYLEGFSGRVGATWMTKEDRENDIKDNINYLNKLYTTTTKDIKSSVKITLLGFSQGGPTICRWFAESKIKFDRLILWAGIFPPDMNNDFTFTAQYLLKDRPTYIIYGNNDPLLKPEHFAEVENYKRIKPDLQVISFEGKHELNEEVLKRISTEQL